MLEFEDDAPPTAVARCTCSVSITRAGLEHVEWQLDFASRLRAFDWGALEHGSLDGARNEAAFRYAFEVRLTQIASVDLPRALPAIERVLVQGGRALPIARAARAFLREISAHIAAYADTFGRTPKDAALVDALIARIDAGAA